MALTQQTGASNQVYVQDLFTDVPSYAPQQFRQPPPGAYPYQQQYLPGQGEPCSVLWRSAEVLCCDCSACVSRPQYSVASAVLQLTVAPPSSARRTACSSSVRSCWRMIRLLHGDTGQATCLHVQAAALLSPVLLTQATCSRQLLHQGPHRLSRWEACTLPQATPACQTRALGALVQPTLCQLRGSMDSLPASSMASQQASSMGSQQRSNTGPQGDSSTARKQRSSMGSRHRRPMGSKRRHMGSKRRPGCLSPRCALMLCVCVPESVTWPC